MATRSTGGDGNDAPFLPDIVPFEVPYLSRLSWELGSRVVEDTESVLIGRWRHSSNRWTLSVFEVTSDTAVIRLRTSVGRERFYGAVQSELKAALSNLKTAPSWQRFE